MSWIGQFPAIYTQSFVQQKIFKIYFGEANKSFFSKLFNLKKHVSETEQEIAKEYYNNLKEISDELLKHIEKLERRITALQQSAFDNI